MLDLRIGGEGREELHHAPVVRRRLEVEDEAELEVRADDGTRLELRKVHAGRSEPDEDIGKRTRTVRKAHHQRELIRIRIDLGLA